MCGKPFLTIFAESDEFEIHSLREPSEFDVDYIRVMAEVLGGEERRVPSIQESIVDQAFPEHRYHKKSFLGQLNRRRVRLLVCGRDYASFIPYLNKIVLKLNDYRWVRDHDVEAKQPFRGIYNGGAARRPGNILLALEYLLQGEPIVNETARRIIIEFARAGELYSTEMRDKLMNVVRIQHRIRVGMLTDSARHVFPRDSVMEAALLRETIHDRLLMGSNFSAERMTMNVADGPPAVAVDNDYSRNLSSNSLPIHENDAYYASVYLRSGYAVRNNIEWGSGVPLHGIMNGTLRFSVFRGTLDGQVMKRRCATSTDSSHVGPIFFWIPAKSNVRSDYELPSAFVETESTDHENRVPKLKDCRIIDGRSESTHFGSIKAGRFRKMDQISPPSPRESQPRSRPNSAPTELGPPPRLLQGGGAALSQLETSFAIIAV